MPDTHTHTKHTHTHTHTHIYTNTNINAHTHNAHTNTKTQTKCKISPQTQSHKTQTHMQVVSKPFQYFWECHVDILPNKSYYTIDCDSDAIFIFIHDKVYEDKVCLPIVYLSSVQFSLFTSILCFTSFVSIENFR